MGADMRKTWIGFLTAGAGLAASLALAGSTEPAHAQSTCSDGQNRWLHVLNLKQSPILYFKNRPAYSRAEWSEDMLGSTSTPPGALVYVWMPNTGCQCRADIQITLSDTNNSVLTYNNINYCSSENGTRARLVVD
jgi:hypothetical protein